MQFHRYQFSSEVIQEQIQFFNYKDKQKKFEKKYDPSMEINERLSYYGNQRLS